VRTGKLVPQPCEVCGAINVHAHHDDYSKPLEVRWLCPEDHSHVHRGALTAAIAVP
jgi:ribosomal protein S27AE